MKFYHENYYEEQLNYEPLPLTVPVLGYGVWGNGQMSTVGTGAPVQGTGGVSGNRYKIMGHFSDEHSLLQSQGRNNHDQDSYCGQ